MPAQIDGMLHAFSSDTGQEVLGFVPTLTLPKLDKLADREYATQHEYFVPMPAPTVEDVVIGGVWRTLLVGGLWVSADGATTLWTLRSVRCQDAVDDHRQQPGSDLRQARNRQAARWRLGGVLRLGYDDMPPGDGVGRLFVVDAATGTLIRSISTGVGSRVRRTQADSRTSAPRVR